MNTRKIIMACANHWTSAVQVGSHHLAREFVRAGWEVAFVSDPISPWHLAWGITPSLRERFALYRCGGRRLLQDQLWAYVPATGMAPHYQPLLRTESVHRHWPRFTWPPLRKVLHKHGFDRADLIYVDSVVHLPWIEEIPRCKLVYRVADRNAAFPKSTPAARRMERDLARLADLAVFSAKPLGDYVQDLGARSSAYLPNGVNFDHFDQGSRACPAEYQALPRPIAVYVGSLDFWFDSGLMRHAARKMPHISFVLIGPSSPSAHELAAEPNIHCLGPRAYDDLPPYLHNANVGLIPFDLHQHAELVHAVNPLKLYEYLACGLPVVAVHWEALHLLNSPALLCRSADEFARGIERMLHEPADRQRLRQFAAGHDWKIQVGRLLDLLEVSGAA